MCGIVGIINFDGESVNYSCLIEFTNSLTHRGPDGYGIWIEQNIGFGHRRLSIFDPTERGKCPMFYGSLKTNETDRYLITYNGEIFNFLEIRKFLISKGYQFKTETDTEVILASYDFWGEDCLFQFNGMWAFAIWDRTKKTLFLARDRFGVKPLYYAKQGNKFYFASEIKAFLSLKDFNISFNEQAAKFLIQNPQNYEGRTEETMIKDVKKLLPGCKLLVDKKGRLVQERWWNTLNHLTSVPNKYEEQVEFYKELFFDAIRIRLRSDVKLGSTLSGGLDSSSIVCSIQEIIKSTPRLNLERTNTENHIVFSAIFPNSLLNEESYIKEVIKNLNLKYHYSKVDLNSTLNDILDSVWIMEEVYNGIGYPVYLVYKNMRENQIIVTLDGHGGDELLGGYTTSYFDVSYQLLNERLYNDFHFDILPSILRNFDRLSMANGVEVRMPFMDWRLVCYTFSLPLSSKVGFGFTKRILRDSMKGILPEKIRMRRSKIGFNAPMIEWFNSILQPLIFKIFNHSLWNSNPFWDGKALRELTFSKFQNKSWTAKDWELSLDIWSKMNFIIWYKMFIEKDRYNFYD